MWLRIRAKFSVATREQTLAEVLPIFREWRQRDDGAGVTIQLPETVVIDPRSSPVKTR